MQTLNQTFTPKYPKNSAESKKFRGVGFRLQYFSLCVLKIFPMLYTVIFSDIYLTLDTLQLFSSLLKALFIISIFLKYKAENINATELCQNASVVIYNYFVSCLCCDQETRWFRNILADIIGYEDCVFQINLKQVLCQT